MRMLQSMFITGLPPLPDFDEQRARKALNEAGVDETGMVKIAIELFRLSPQSAAGDGKDVLATLDDLFPKRKITLANLQGLAGLSDKQERTIQMDRGLLANAADLSIWLVHEAYHLTRSELYIDEEIHSRELQGQYWDWLVKGVKYGAKTYSAKATGYILEKYRKNQIVDWVLESDEYDKSKDFLTRDWILKHINDWGGPNNRTLETSRKYARSLLDDSGRDPQTKARVGEVMFAILSNSSLRKDETRKLIFEAGNGDLEKGLNLLHEVIAPAISQTQLLNRVVDWERSSGFDLGFKS